jgi:hypothetical protein
MGLEPAGAQMVAPLWVFCAVWPSAAANSRVDGRAVVRKHQNKPSGTAAQSLGTRQMSTFVSGDPDHQGCTAQSKTREAARSRSGG